MVVKTCRQLLNQVIGLKNGNAVNAVCEEEVNVLEDLAVFDKDDINTLCKSVSRPRGTILNPVLDPADLVVEIAPALPNYGFNIPVSMNQG